MLKDIISPVGFNNPVHVIHIYDVVGVVGGVVAFLVGYNVCIVWHRFKLCASKREVVVEVLNVGEVGSGCVKAMD
jgi:hypothetical protein